MALYFWIVLTINTFVKMMHSNIEQLVQKYLKGTASNEELQILKEWISVDTNKKTFQEYIEIQLLLDHKYEIYDVDDAHNKLMVLLEEVPVRSLKRKRKYTALLKYAAVVMALVSLSILVKREFFTSHELQVSDDAITIQMDNGNLEIISPSGEKTILDENGQIVGKQSGTVLSYSGNAVVSNGASNLNENINPEVLKYNEISIPYGKTFQVVLSDGTIAHLNAGTSLKYPVKFLNGKHRKVFLEGEAYFEVAKDVKHPFIVSTNDIDVRALGTAFNVTSYQEDQDINTTLVEGSVGVYKSDAVFDLQASLILEPGQQAGWNKTSENMSVEDVDTSIYTGWVEGKVIFNHMPFREIIKKLERHYNVSIQNNNEQLNNETFTATFDIETIEDVLNAFGKNFKIDFSIENDHVTIN